MENPEEVPEPLKKKKPTAKKKSNFTQEEANKLIKEVMASHLKEARKTRDLELDSLVATVEEFLQAFIIIGYDLSHRPVVVMQAKDQMEADALSTSLTKVFLDAHKDRG
jgi:hypothetical protein